MIKESSKLKELFLSLGYNEEEYTKIISTYPLFNLKEDTLYKKVKENYKFLISLNYSKEEVIKMTKAIPAIYGYSIDTMKQKITDIISLGYSKEEVIKMTKAIPTIYSLSIDNMKQKITDIISLGYSKEEVIKMTKAIPTIYSLSIDNMKQKITDIISLGYSKEEVITMTKKLPTIYGLSIENISQKIEFYDSIGLHDLTMTDTNKLMQSTALSYARYMFYKENGIDIDINNYRKLFIDQKKFKKIYGITKKELIEKYNYSKYLEEKNNGRTL